MESVKVIYKHGHYYDKKTGARLFFEDSEELILVSKKLISNNPMNISHDKILNSSQKLNQVNNDRIVKKSIFALSKNTLLYFDISFNLYRDKNNPRFSYTFEVCLDEDLYFYLTDKDKVKSYSSKCTVTKELNNDLPFFEEIYSFSVNNSYEKTYIYYFAHHGSPTANAYDKIYLKSDNDDSKIYLKEIRNKLEKTLKKNT